MLYSQKIFSETPLKKREQQHQRCVSQAGCKTALFNAEAFRYAKAYALVNRPAASSKMGLRLSNLISAVVYGGREQP